MSYHNTNSNFQILTLPKFLTTLSRPFLKEYFSLRMAAFKVDSGSLWGGSLLERKREIEGERRKRALVLSKEEENFSGHGDTFFT